MCPEYTPDCLAEREGFEPSIRYKRIHTFQACSFSHSDTSPEIVFCFHERGWRGVRGKGGNFKA